MNEKTCFNCGCLVKENDYTKCPEEINFEAISINGIFGDSIICSECFHKFNKVEVNNERKD